MAGFDPFIFESNERTFVVLAEEWYYPINHGRITRCKRKHNGLVLHTFNHLDGLTAIDGWDYTHRHVGRFVEKLRRIYRKFVPAKPLRR